MSIMIDTLPYQIYKKLQHQFVQKKILIRPDDIMMPGVVHAYKNPEEYVTALFRREGYEVIRYKHEYDSLTTSNPRLGIVFMANDSVIVPGYEAIGLIGHSIRPLSIGESTYSDAK